MIGGPGECDASASGSLLLGDSALRKSAAGSEAAADGYHAAHT